MCRCDASVNMILSSPQAAQYSVHHDENNAVTIAADDTNTVDNVFFEFCDRRALLPE